MTPKRVRIFRCEACQGLFAHRYSSEMTYPSTTNRSDEPKKPGLSDYAPPLVACPHCREAYCLLGAEHESEFLSLNYAAPVMSDTIQKIPNFIGATLAQCEAHAQKWDDTDLEWEFRLQAWHRLNDARMLTSPRKLNPAQQHSLRRLLAICTHNEPLIRVELLRQMRRFEEAADAIRTFNALPWSNSRQLKAAIEQKNDQPFYYR